MVSSYELGISRHAAMRCAQRAVTRAKFSQLWEHADIEVPVGGGSVLYRLSHAAAAECGLKGIGRLALIVGENTLVTVLRVSDGRSGRRYRRTRR